MARTPNALVLDVDSCNQLSGCPGCGLNRSRSRARGGGGDRRALGRGSGKGSSPVEWCNRFVSFGLGYALSWSGVSSCWVGWGVSRDLVRMSRLR